MVLGGEGWLNTAESDPGSCLATIEKTVNYLFCEPLTVGEIFGSAELDTLCQKIGRSNLLRLGLASIPRGQSDATVFIASRLQVSGGHTAVLADIIRLSPNRHAIVVITNVCGRSDTAAIPKRFGSLKNVEFIYVPPGNHLAKLDWLQIYLHKIAPSEVWLFNHHQDSVAIAAVQPDRGYKLNFYHHGDDRLCLGASLGFGAHFDPSPFLFHNCRTSLGIENNRYLPLCVADQGYIPPGSSSSSGLVTCTAAGHNKVEVNYFIQYADIISQLLKHTRGRHIHIGRLTPLARLRIRNSLRKEGIPPNSFCYLPYVASVWRALQEHKVDLYIASFPYGAGRTMVEVMGAGIPIVIHKHVRSRMIGGLDMVYDGARTWRKPEELFEVLKVIDRSFLTGQGRMARAWYEKYHHDSIVSTLLAREDDDCVVPNLKAGYQPDKLLSAWQVTAEMKCFKIFKRSVYRAYRQVKSICGRII